MFGGIIEIISGKRKEFKALRRLAEEIGAREPELAALSGAELLARSQALRSRSAAGGPDTVLIDSFALVRETAKRVINQRHFDVQLMGGLVLHQGKIVEMATGEGKTLAATAPAYLNALSGKSVHIITVNDYLARRDTVWMGQIYHALGMSVACLTHEQAFLYDPRYKTETEKEDKERDVLGGFKIFENFLRPVSRREAYQADILYGTNHEFGFDYLRDNLAYDAGGQVQRGHHYAIIDEVDSILIDEARTPLIISAPDAESSKNYKIFARVVDHLRENEDYTVDEKHKSTAIAESGIDKVEKMLGIANVYSAENIKLAHYLNESLRAKALFRRDKEYVVKNGEVVIVDEFTGRLMFGRRYSGGLHQAIEAKEGVDVKEESRTYAQITIQNYFRLYEKIAGMTGTAQTSAEEFHKVYSLEVVSVPPNKPMIRKDLPDLVYRTTEAKYQAAVEEVREMNKLGQPVLIGTVSIEKNELISGLLARAGVNHEVLNAKNHEREGAIIAQAGRQGAVTVATNMAGRGVDIILGGNPPDPEEAEKVKKLGGLFVVGTERHEARRIDNQLRGRSGRQGDPGETRFYLSLEDDLLRIFGGEKIKKLMAVFNLPDDIPIESKSVSRAVGQSQAKVEGLNFDARRHLLDFDDILNKQRRAVYSRRQEILESGEEKLRVFVKGVVRNQVPRIAETVAVSPYVMDWPFGDLKKTLTETGILSDETAVGFDKLTEELKNEESETARKKLEEYLKEAAEKALPAESNKGLILRILDMLWMEHLENMDALREAVGMRAYAQHNPLVEYRREGHRFYGELMRNFEVLIFSNIFKTVSFSAQSAGKSSLSSDSTATRGRVGRNDPCYCGSGKKYKKCHGK